MDIALQRLYGHLPALNFSRCSMEVDHPSCRIQEINLRTWTDDHRVLENGVGFLPVESFLTIRGSEFGDMGGHILIEQLSTRRIKRCRRHIGYAYKQ